MTECMFCDLMEKRANVLFEDEKVFVMLSPEPAVAGHMVVVPKQHAPIAEKVPDFVVGRMFGVANKASVALFEGLGAQGTNVLLQNGTAAGQRHNHVMLHVVPRFENDKLSIGWNPQQADEEQLSDLEAKIKDQTANVGAFEREKEKPVELEKPEEVKEKDYRLKQLERIP